VKEKYSNITSKHLKYRIDNKIDHDIKTPMKYNSKFNNKRVSNLRHFYQMDIFENNTISSTKSNIYPYYLILININTRYVELHHLQNISSTSDIKCPKTHL
jgi:hypothetical protein